MDKVNLDIAEGTTTVTTTAAATTAAATTTTTTEGPCEPMLFSKLNGMVPAVLDYSTLKTGGRTSLAACHDLCRSHGSTYFESGTAGRHHANNCVCAKVSQTMPPNPDGNANWNIYTVCPKPSTTTTTGLPKWA